jgi:putative DNA primase/helicase
MRLVRLGTDEETPFFSDYHHRAGVLGLPRTKGSVVDYGFNSIKEFNNEDKEEIRRAQVLQRWRNHGITRIKHLAQRTVGSLSLAELEFLLPWLQKVEERWQLVDLDIKSHYWALQEAIAQARMEQQTARSCADVEESEHDPRQPPAPQEPKKEADLSTSPQSDPPQKNAAAPKTNNVVPYPVSAYRQERDGDRPLPVSDVGERGLLCALLLSPAKTAKLCANRIAPRTFMNPAYGSLYELIFEWTKAGQEVSLNWLVERIGGMKLFQELGGRSGLADLYAFDIADNAEFNIALVIEAYRRRELILRYESLTNRCFDRNDELSEILKTNKETIAEIGVSGGQRFEKLLEATLNGAEFSDIRIPPRIPIIRDWLMEGDLGFIFAYRGSGKTWLILQLASALADGSMFGPWEVLGKWSVLYIDGEMMSADIQERIKALNGGKIPADLHVLNHEILYHRSELVLNLADPIDQQHILQLCLKRKIHVLMLDNLGCLFTGVKENDAAEWEKVLPWLLEMRRHKIAVIIIHHTGVDPSRMRGTTKREDPASFSIRLEDKKEDFSVPGARFITRFRKYRGREAILDHEWNFRPEGDKVLVTFKEASRADVVLQWVRDGLSTCSEIAREMGISNGQVSKIATRLISEGRLAKSNRGYEAIES